jgi:GH43 family beta-xylosidase
MDTNKSNKPIVEQRADPFIYRHTDGYYYFTGSVPTYDCIELRKSKTISGLREAEPFIVWRKHETGPMSRHIGLLKFITSMENGLFICRKRRGRYMEITAYVLECKGPDPLKMIGLSWDK